MPYDKKKNDKESNSYNIELRGERMRRIIGDIPPALTLYGFAALILTVAVIAVVGYFFLKGNF